MSNTTLATSVRPDMADMFEALAEEDGMTVSEKLREMIEHAVEEWMSVDDWSLEGWAK